jgi:hypothetical protein
MPTHKNEDFKISAVNYYLDSNKTQEEVCDIFKCSVRSLMRWVATSSIKVDIITFGCYKI